MSDQSLITIKGARTHNLDISHLELPRNKLVVITGPSGSGKSSLALKTLYAEGQRRYVGSLSTYARQFLSVMDKPDVDAIEGLSPAIAIEQKAGSHNPRSTVGTITEVYDYVRLLFARIGTPHCPTHKKPLHAMSVSQIIDQLLADALDEKIHILATIVSNQKGAHQGILDSLQQRGFIRLRINGQVQMIQEATIDPNKKNHIELVVDRLRVTKEAIQRLAESIETAVDLGKGSVAILLEGDEQPKLFSTKHACSVCHWSISNLEPKMFSFNNPLGACQSCDGLGMRRFIRADNLVINDQLSLDEGALWHWDKQHKHYFNILQSVARHFNIDMYAPWKELPQDQRDLILYGSKGKRITMIYPDIYGNLIQRKRIFEGAIPSLERRYFETESEAVKENLNKLMTYDACQTCSGSRLNEAASHVLIEGQSICHTINLSIEQLHSWTKSLKLPAMQQKIAEKILNEIINRCQFLLSVGLNYLSLNRAADTLSGGEAQRIRLASQVGAGLVGVMYVLDEPSIGLHMRDNQRLIDTLIHLRDLGNTVIVVEHDEEIMRQADQLIDIGPGAGIHGGQVTAQGHINQLLNDPKSLTGAYLSQQESIPIPKKRSKPGNQWIGIQGASNNNLKNIDTQIPVGLLTCITGVSGSGKSTLINDTLFPYVNNYFNKSNRPVGKHTRITGIEHLDKVIDIDQSPIGRTPRSNPATYTGIFTHIRDLFAQTEESRSRGYQARSIQLQCQRGRCESCRGDGLIKVEMHFLADVYVECDLCQGTRFNRETLSVLYRDLNIAQVLNLTVEEAMKVFKNIPSIYKKLTTLHQVGLGYVKLGQSATTLSGGEAQRIKLSRELSKRSTGKTLFILDEPTTGLHF